jgi:quercetin dioxygenase-like cupin family protein
MVLLVNCRKDRMVWTDFRSAAPATSRLPAFGAAADGDRPRSAGARTVPVRSALINKSRPNGQRNRSTQRKSLMNATQNIQTGSNPDQVKYVPATTGPMCCGPGDRVSFLVTGAESHGGCFIAEGMAAPGGGPPPHLHHFEDESFYILEGSATFQADGQTIHAKPGDFIYIPRGTVHSFRNDGTVPARALVIISPAGPKGMQQFFEESFYRIADRSALPPLITEALGRRMMAAAAKNGLEFVQSAGR